MAAAPQRILIVRLGAMGDVIHALPAVAMLRAALPDALIGWAIEERWTELLSAPEAVLAPRSPHKPLADKIHVINTREWRRALLSDETWKDILVARRGLREMKYDLALDLQGAWKSGAVAHASGANLRIGFRQPRERGASMFYTQQVAAAGAHIIDQNISLAAAALRRYDLENLGSSDLPLLPRDTAAESWCDATLARHSLQANRFAILNPGAGWDAKCWPVEKYGEVARNLAQDGIRSVVNFGPAEEPLAREVEANSDDAATAIPCSVGELIAITRRARLFIGGDTGPMHLAAAFKVPVVGIFGPTDPARNGPYGTESIVLRRPGSVTNHSRRGAPDEEMLSITVTEVLSAARSLLARCPARDQEAPRA